MQIASLFPFIPPHVFVLAYALVLIWVVFRWGPIIFMGYALWNFWFQHLDLTIYYFIAAMFVGWVKACVMFLARCAGYRGPWL